MPTIDNQILPCVNGHPLCQITETLSEVELQQRAFTELLRQQAIESGLLDANDCNTSDGVLSEAANAAIETLLEQEIVLAQPDEDSCKRHFAANQHLYKIDEKVHARHILFAVTEGVDVNALRQKAEHTLLNLRCYESQDANDVQQNFDKLAKQLSNCPSAQQGGDLGWLQKSDCAPEFAEAIFANNEVGILAKLVMSRFGFHIVEILERMQGQDISFEEVKTRVQDNLYQGSYVTALRQYIGLLAAKFDVKGVPIDEFTTSLVQ